MNKDQDCRACNRDSHQDGQLEMFDLSHECFQYPSENKAGKADAACPQQSADNIEQDKPHRRYARYPDGQAAGRAEAGYEPGKYDETRM